MREPRQCPGCKRIFKSGHSLGLHFWQNKRRNIDCETGLPQVPVSRLKKKHLTR